jgi:hypothetical protein
MAGMDRFIHPALSIAAAIAQYTASGDAGLDVS